MRISILILVWVVHKVDTGKAWQWAAAPGTLRNPKGVSGAGIGADTRRLELLPKKSAVSKTPEVYSVLYTGLRSPLI